MILYNMIRPRFVSKSGKVLINKTLRGRAAARRRRAGIAKVVKKVLRSHEETKHVGANVVDAAFNSSISAASECYPVIPAVTEGTAGYQRSGDEIRPKYLIVKGHLQYDHAFQGNFAPPSTVRVMILTQKNIKAATDVGSRADVSHLLRDNIATDTARAYTGSMFDNLAPINKDLFNVLMDRKFKMLPQLYTGLGNSSDTNTKTLSGTQRTYYFTKKIKCPAKLYYDDGNANVANNFAPFICMGGVTDDGSGPFSLNTPYHLTVQGELYFTDP